MIFRWFRQFQRHQLWKRPIPAKWHELLSENAVFLEDVEEETKTAILRSVQVFCSEKNWEGCGGLKLTDEHRATISAQIAKMTLGMGVGEVDGEYFPEVQSILVYPEAYLADTKQHIGAGVVMESRDGRLGEAWHRGPVILSWQDVLATGRRQNFARNVVIHEFAHHLDMRNGRDADGIPVIESSDLGRRWREVTQRCFGQLQEMCRNGSPRLLDCYGATSLSEFFAVASEVFFEEPHAMRHHWPELFDLFNEFYFPHDFAQI